MVGRLPPTILAFIALCVVYLQLCLSPVLAKPYPKQILENTDATGARRDPGEIHWSEIVNFDDGETKQELKRSSAEPEDILKDQRGFKILTDVPSKRDGVETPIQALQSDNTPSAGQTLRSKVTAATGSTSNAVNTNTVQRNDGSALNSASGSGSGATQNLQTEAAKSSEIAKGTADVAGSKRQEVSTNAGNSGSGASGSGSPVKADGSANSNANAATKPNDSGTAKGTGAAPSANQAQPEPSSVTVQGNNLNGKPMQQSGSPDPIKDKLGNSGSEVVTSHTFYHDEDFPYSRSKVDNNEPEVGHFQVDDKSADLEINANSAGVKVKAKPASLQVVSRPGSSHAPSPVVPVPVGPMFRRHHPHHHYADGYRRGMPYHHHRRYSEPYHAYYRAWIPPPHHHHRHYPRYDDEAQFYRRSPWNPFHPHHHRHHRYPEDLEERSDMGYPYDYPRFRRGFQGPYRRGFFPGYPSQDMQSRFFMPRAMRPRLRDVVTPEPPPINVNGNPPPGIMNDESQGMMGMNGMPGMNGMAGMNGMEGMPGMGGMNGIGGMNGMGMGGMNGMGGMSEMGMNSLPPFTGMGGMGGPGSFPGMRNPGLEGLGGGGMNRFEDMQSRYVSPIGENPEESAITRSLGTRNVNGAEPSKTAKKTNIQGKVKHKKKNQHHTKKSEVKNSHVVPKGWKDILKKSNQSTTQKHRTRRASDSKDNKKRKHKVPTLHSQKTKEQKGSRRNDVIIHRPPIIYHPPPEVYHRPDIVVHRAPIMLHRPAIIYHQPPVVVHRPAVIYHQPPIVFHQPPPVVNQPILHSHDSYVTKPVVYHTTSSMGHSSNYVGIPENVYAGDFGLHGYHGFHHGFHGYNGFHGYHGMHGFGPYRKHEVPHAEGNQTIDEDTADKKSVVKPDETRQKRDLYSSYIDYLRYQGSLWRPQYKRDVDDGFDVLAASDSAKEQLTYTDETHKHTHDIKRRSAEDDVSGPVPTKAKRDIDDGFDFVASEEASKEDLTFGNKASHNVEKRDTRDGYNTYLHQIWNPLPVANNGLDIHKRDEDDEDDEDYEDESDESAGSKKKKKDVVVNRPPIIYHPPPEIYHRPDIVVHRPPLVIHRPPIIYHQPPVIVHRPAVVYHQPPIVFHQPPPAVSQPLLFSHDSFTVHPSFYATHHGSVVRDYGHYIGIPNVVSNYGAPLFHSHAAYGKRSKIPKHLEGKKKSETTSHLKRKKTKTEKGEKKNSVVIRRPPIIYHPPPEIYHRPDIVVHRAPIMIHRAPIIYHQPPVVVHRPAIVYHQPSLVFHQPPPVVQQPFLKSHDTWMTHNVAVPVSTRVGHRTTYIGVPHAYTVHGYAGLGHTHGYYKSKVPRKNEDVKADARDVIAKKKHHNLKHKNQKDKKGEKKNSVIIKRPPIIYHPPPEVFHRPDIIVHRPPIMVHRADIVYHQPPVIVHRPAVVYHQPTLVFHQPAPMIHQPVMHARDTWVQRPSLKLYGSTMHRIGEVTHTPRAYYHGNGHLQYLAYGKSRLPHKAEEEETPDARTKIKHGDSDGDKDEDKEEDKVEDKDGESGAEADDAVYDTDLSGEGIELGSGDESGSGFLELEVVKDGSVGANLRKSKVATESGSKKDTITSHAQTEHTEKGHKKNSVVIHRPPIIYHPPPEIYHRPDIVVHRAPIVLYRAPIIYHQPPVVVHRPAIVYHQPAIVFHQPPPVVNQPIMHSHDTYVTHPVVVPVGTRVSHAGVYHGIPHEEMFMPGFGHGAFTKSGVPDDIGHRRDEVNGNQKKDSDKSIGAKARITRALEDTWKPFLEEPKPVSEIKEPIGAGNRIVRAVQEPHGVDYHGYQSVQEVTVPIGAKERIIRASQEMPYMEDAAADVRDIKKSIGAGERVRRAILQPHTTSELGSTPDDDKSNDIHKRSPERKKKKDVVVNRPPIIYHPPPEVYHRPEIIVHRAPILIHRPPIVYHQPPVVVHRPAVVYHQPPIVFHQPPPAVNQPMLYSHDQFVVHPTTVAQHVNSVVNEGGHYIGIPQGGISNYPGSLNLHAAQRHFQPSFSPRYPVPGYSAFPSMRMGKRGKVERPEAEQSGEDKEEDEEEDNSGSSEENETETADDAPKKLQKQKSTKGERKNTVVINRPDMVYHPPPEIYDRPNVIVHRPDLVIHRPSIVYHQPSVVIHRPPIIYHQPPVVFHQPPPMTHQPIMKSVDSYVAHSYYEPHASELHHVATYNGAPHYYPGANPYGWGIQGAGPVAPAPAPAAFGPVAPAPAPAAFGPAFGRSSVEKSQKKSGKHKKNSVPHKHHPHHHHHHHHHHQTGSKRHFGHFLLQNPMMPHHFHKKHFVVIHRPPVVFRPPPEVVPRPDIVVHQPDIVYHRPPIAYQQPPTVVHHPQIVYHQTPVVFHNTPPVVSSPYVMSHDVITPHIGQVMQPMGSYVHPEGSYFGVPPAYVPAPGLFAGSAVVKSKVGGKDSEKETSGEEETKGETKRSNVEDNLKESEKKTEDGSRKQDIVVNRPPLVYTPQPDVFANPPVLLPQPDVIVKRPPVVYHQAPVIIHKPPIFYHRPAVVMPAPIYHVPMFHPGMAFGKTKIAHKSKSKKEKRDASKKEEKHKKGHRKNVIMVQRPAMIYHPPPEIYDRPDVIVHRPDLVIHRPSIVYHQPSVVVHRPPIVYHEPPVVFHQPPPMVRQPIMHAHDTYVAHSYYEPQASELHHVATYNGAPHYYPGANPYGWGIQGAGPVAPAPAPAAFGPAFGKSKVSKGKGKKEAEKPRQRRSVDSKKTDSNKSSKKGDKKNNVMIMRPAMIYHPPPEIYDKPDVIVHRPDLVIHRPSIVYHQPSVVVHRPPVIYHQPPVVFHQPPPMVRQPIVHSHDTYVAHAYHEPYASTISHAGTYVGAPHYFQGGFGYGVNAGAGPWGAAFGKSKVPTKKTTAKKPKTKRSTPEKGKSNKEPKEGDKKNTVVVQRPPMLYHPPPEIYHRPDVIVHRPDIVIHRPSVVYHQPSVVVHRPPIIYHEPPVVFHQPPPMVRQPIMHSHDTYAAHAYYEPHASHLSHAGTYVGAPHYYNGGWGYGYGAGPAYGKSKVTKQSKKSKRSVSEAKGVKNHKKGKAEKGGKKNVVVMRRPSVVYHPPPEVYHRPDVILHRPDIVIHRPSVVFHQAPVVVHRPSVVYHQPPIVFHQPPPMVHQPIMHSHETYMPHSYYEPHSSHIQHAGTYVGAPHYYHGGWGFGYGYNQGHSFGGGGGGGNGFGGNGWGGHSFGKSKVEGTSDKVQKKDSKKKNDEEDEDDDNDADDDNDEDDEDDTKKPKAKAKSKRSIEDADSQVQEAFQSVKEKLRLRRDLDDVKKSKRAAATKTTKGEKKNKVIIHRPAMIYHPPPEIYDRPDVIVHRPDLVYHQPSIVYHQPSVVIHRPPIIYESPPVVFHQPPPMVNQQVYHAHDSYVAHQYFEPTSSTLHHTMTYNGAPHFYNGGWGWGFGMNHGPGNAPNAGPVNAGPVNGFAAGAHPGPLNGFAAGAHPGPLADYAAAPNAGPLNGYAGGYAGVGPLLGAGPVSATVPAAYPAAAPLAAAPFGPAFAKSSITRSKFLKPKSKRSTEEDEDEDEDEEDEESSGESEVKSRVAAPKSHDKHDKGLRKNVVVMNRPPMIYHPPPEVYHRPDVIVHRPDIVIHRPSVVLHQAPVVVHRPAVVYHQSPVIMHQPPPLVHQPIIHSHDTYMPHSYYEPFASHLSHVGTYVGAPHNFGGGWGYGYGHAIGGYGKSKVEKSKNKDNTQSKSKVEKSKKSSKKAKIYHPQKGKEEKASKKNDIVVNRPPIIYHPPPEVYHRPDIVVHRAPIVLHRPPIIYHQPPVIVHRPAVVYHQPPIVFHQPPPAVHQPVIHSHDTFVVHPSASYEPRGSTVSHQTNYIGIPSHVEHYDEANYGGDSYGGYHGDYQGGFHGGFHGGLHGGFHGFHGFGGHHGFHGGMMLHRSKIEHAKEASAKGEEDSASKSAIPDEDDTHPEEEKEKKVSKRQLLGSHSLYETLTPFNVVHPRAPLIERLQKKSSIPGMPSTFARNIAKRDLDFQRTKRQFAFPGANYLPQGIQPGVSADDAHASNLDMNQMLQAAQSLYPQAAYGGPVAHAPYYPGYPFMKPTSPKVRVHVETARSQIPANRQRRQVLPFFQPQMFGALPAYGPGLLAAGPGPLGVHGPLAVHAPAQFPVFGGGFHPYSSPYPYYPHTAPHRPSVNINVQSARSSIPKPNRDAEENSRQKRQLFAPGQMINPYALAMSSLMNPYLGGMGAYNPYMGLAPNMMGRDDDGADHDSDDNDVTDLRNANWQKYMNALSMYNTGSPMFQHRRPKVKVDVQAAKSSIPKTQSGDKSRDKRQFPSYVPVSPLLTKRYNFPSSGKLFKRAEDVNQKKRTRRSVEMKEQKNTKSTGNYSKRDEFTRQFEANNDISTGPITGASDEQGNLPQTAGQYEGGSNPGVEGMREEGPGGLNGLNMEQQMQDQPMYGNHEQAAAEQANQDVAQRQAVVGSDPRQGQIMTGASDMPATANFMGAHQAFSPNQAGPNPVGPLPMSPAEMGPLAAGPGGMGLFAAGPGEMGPFAAGPGAMGPLAAGPGAMGPFAAGPGPMGPLAAGPAAMGPFAAGPGAMGPLAAGPAAMGPFAAGPAPMGPFPFGAHHMALGPNVPLSPLVQQVPFQGVPFHGGVPLQDSLPVQQFLPQAAFPMASPLEALQQPEVPGHASVNVNINTAKKHEVATPSTKDKTKNDKRQKISFFTRVPAMQVLPQKFLQNGVIVPSFAGKQNGNDHSAHGINGMLLSELQTQRNEIPDKSKKGKESAHKRQFYNVPVAGLPGQALPVAPQLAYPARPRVSVNVQVARKSKTNGKEEKRPRSSRSKRQIYGMNELPHPEASAHVHTAMKTQRSAKSEIPSKQPIKRQLYNVPQNLPLPAFTATGIPLTGHQSPKVSVNVQIAKKSKTSKVTKSKDSKDEKQGVKKQMLGFLPQQRLMVPAPFGQQAVVPDNRPRVSVHVETSKKSTSPVKAKKGVKKQLVGFLPQQRLMVPAPFGQQAVVPVNRPRVSVHVETSKKSTSPVKAKKKGTISSEKEKGNKRQFVEDSLRGDVHPFERRPQAVFGDEHEQVIHRFASSPEQIKQVLEDAQQNQGRDGLAPQQVEQALQAQQDEQAQQVQMPFSQPLDQTPLATMGGPVNPLDTPRQVNINVQITKSTIDKNAKNSEDKSSKEEKDKKISKRQMFGTVPLLSPIAHMDVPKHVASTGEVRSAVPATEKQNPRVVKRQLYNFLGGQQAPVQTHQVLQPQVLQQQLPQQFAGENLAMNQNAANYQLAQQQAQEQAFASAHLPVLGQQSAAVMPGAMMQQVMPMEVHQPQMVQTPYGVVPAFPRQKHVNINVQTTKSDVPRGQSKKTTVEKVHTKRQVLGAVPLGTSLSPQPILPLNINQVPRPRVSVHVETNKRDQGATPQRKKRQLADLLQNMIQRRAGPKLLGGLIKKPRQNSQFVIGANNPIEIVTDPPANAMRGQNNPQMSQQEMPLEALLSQRQQGFREKQQPEAVQFNDAPVFQNDQPGVAAANQGLPPQVSQQQNVMPFVREPNPMVVQNDMAPVRMQLPLPPQFNAPIMPAARALPLPMAFPRAPVFGPQFLPMPQVQPQPFPPFGPQLPPFPPFMPPFLPPMAPPLPPDAAPGLPLQNPFPPPGVENGEDDDRPSVNVSVKTSKSKIPK